MFFLISLLGRKMKRSSLLSAVALTASLLQSAAAMAADDTTFFGISLGAHSNFRRCGAQVTEICSVSQQTINALVGGQVTQLDLVYPRGTLPDWFVLNTTQVGIRDDNVEGMLFAVDIPSRAIGQKGIKELHQHLVEKLGPESKREKIEVSGQPYHYVATWNKPYGKVTFETVAQISTSSVLLPVIRVQSNKWIALLDGAEKIRQQRKAEEDAKKIKF
ncbi:hypothetical protein [uncultured Herbaspirillum sp.]|uniref:hypothetical protein n=1 Tax=uncultured Herbaspirillum sp. TaxID=160236 RepID=UPI00263A22A8|nr:hypothetical protein [uncultured Herbaspirillum sp.]